MLIEVLAVQFYSWSLRLLFQFVEHFQVLFDVLAVLATILVDLAKLSIKSILAFATYHHFLYA